MNVWEIQTNDHLMCNAFTTFYGNYESKIAVFSCENELFAMSQAIKDLSNAIC